MVAYSRCRHLHCDIAIGDVISNIHIYVPRKDYIRGFPSALDELVLLVRTCNLVKSLICNSLTKAVVTRS